MHSAGARLRNGRMIDLHVSGACAACARGTSYCGRGARKARSVLSMLALVSMAARRVCRRSAR
eukprot:4444658-Prymnesium_polylepis.1